MKKILETTEEGIRRYDAKNGTPNLGHAFGGHDPGVCALAIQGDRAFRRAGSLIRRAARWREL